MSNLILSFLSCDSSRTSRDDVEHKALILPCSLQKLLPPLFSFRIFLLLLLLLLLLGLLECLLALLDDLLKELRNSECEKIIHLDGSDAC